MFWHFLVHFVGWKSQFLLPHPQFLHSNFTLKYLRVYARYKIGVKSVDRGYLGLCMGETVFIEKNLRPRREKNDTS